MNRVKYFYCAFFLILNLIFKSPLLRPSFLSGIIIMVNYRTSSDPRWLVGRSRLVPNLRLEQARVRYHAGSYLGVGARKGLEGREVKCRLERKGGNSVKKKTIRPWSLEKIVVGRDSKMADLMVAQETIWAVLWRSPRGGAWWSWRPLWFSTPRDTATW